MSRFLVIVALLALAHPALAEDEPKPNTLTPKEIADGWLLLFDGESTYGWKEVESKDGGKPKIEVKGSSLVLGGKGSSVHLNARIQYFELIGEFRSSVVGNQLTVRMVPPGKLRGLTLGNALHPGNRPDQWEKLCVRTTPKEMVIQAGSSGVKGPRFGSDLLANIEFALSDDEEGRIELRNLKLRPLEETPLFDGKTLDGWSVNQTDPKRIASKWTVTKDSEISLKNGPGDLVCDKQFDNFVLQLECKTQSPAANSGVFFRCIPGQYQNGYEAQIQNSFVGKDRGKPVDFGTGAIYRRIPARKVVSEDNEWFTMTIVAEGKHIATWVNGYQTVDWTDTRPADDNPRKGYRAAKGPISLQGHDPTTDILFRNIRITELPAEMK